MSRLSMTVLLMISLLPGAGFAAELDLGFLNLPTYDFERVVPETPAPTPSPDEADAKIKVGDSLILRIQGLGEKAKHELKLEVPSGTDSLSDQGWDLDISGGKPAPEGEFRVKVTPLKAGKISLPSLAIIEAQEGESESKAFARTNPYNLEVESAIRQDDPKPDQPADLRPPVSLRFPWWVLAAAGLVFLLLIVGGVYAYRKAKARRAKPVQAAPAEPPKPEDEVALAAIAELEKNTSLKRGEFKPHYFRVSEIVKTYLGARYDFDASESTTRELISVLEDRKVLADHQIDRLESLFERLDLVKFTDHTPLPEEGMRLLGVVRDLVLATRRPPELLAEAKYNELKKAEVVGVGVKKS